MSDTVVPIPGDRFLRHRIQKMVSRYDECLNSGGEYVDKQLTFALYVPINVSNNLDFVSVNGPRQTSFVDTGTY